MTFSLTSTATHSNRGISAETAFLFWAERNLLRLGLEAWAEGRRPPCGDLWPQGTLSGDGARRAGRAGRPRGEGCVGKQTQRDTLSRSRSQVLISRDGLCCSPSPSGEARSRGRAQARQGPTLNPLLQRSLHSYTCGSLSLGNQIKTVSGDAT